MSNAELDALFQKASVGDGRKRNMLPVFCSCKRRAVSDGRRTCALRSRAACVADSPGSGSSPRRISQVLNDESGQFPECSCHLDEHAARNVLARPRHSRVHYGGAILGAGHTPEAGPFCTPISSLARRKFRTPHLTFAAALAANTAKRHPVS